MVRLAIQNEEFAQTDLTQEEMNLLVGQWNDLYTPAWSFERQYQNNKLETIKLFAAVAKNSLDELKFGGFNCGNSEIGITPIRPGQVGLVELAACEADNVWKWKHDTRRELNGNGFENWIHSPTTATTAFACPEDACYYPMYIVEENACPKIQTVKMDIGRTNILHYDVRASRIRDYQTGINLIPLPTTFWLGEMDVLVALGFMSTGVTEPRLGGFCIAKGSFLNATSYHSATNTVVPNTTASV
jgi:hypothetical protein